MTYTFITEKEYYVFRQHTRFYCKKQNIFLCFLCDTGRMISRIIQRQINISLMPYIRIMRLIKRRNKMSDTEHAGLPVTLWDSASMNPSLRRASEPPAREDKTRTSFSRRRCGLSGISRLRRGIWAAASAAFLSAARCVAPFIIPPSLRHYRIILLNPHIFSSFRLPLRLFRNSIPVPVFPPSTLLCYRLSISRSTAVTFKRNLHNGVVWKSVFSAGTIAIVSGK